MQLTSLFFSILVTLAAAAPVAEPQGLGFPDGGNRPARAADPQVRWNDPGRRHPAVRDAAPQFVDDNNIINSAIAKRAPVAFGIAEPRAVRPKCGDRGCPP